jgi:hypothetical protein
MILTSIDYFSGTGFFNSIIEVERFINEISQLMNPKDEYYIEEQEIRIGEKFTSRIGSVFKMYGGIRATSGRVKLILQLPGSFCKRIENQKEAIKFLSEHLKATRIDIALDDYDRRINQSAIDKLGQLGHYKGVERYELQQFPIKRTTKKLSQRLKVETTMLEPIKSIFISNGIDRISNSFVKSLDCSSFSRTNNFF